MAAPSHNVTPRLLGRIHQQSPTQRQTRVVSTEPVRGQKRPVAAFRLDRPWDTRDQHVPPRALVLPQPRPPQVALFLGRVQRIRELRRRVVTDTKGVQGKVHVHAEHPQRPPRHQYERNRAEEHGDEREAHRPSDEPAGLRSHHLRCDDALVPVVLVLSSKCGLVPRIVVIHVASIVVHLRGVRPERVVADFVGISPTEQVGLGGGWRQGGSVPVECPVRTTGGRGR